MTKSGDPTKGDERDRSLARLEKALGEALARTESVESMLEDQRQRLKALGTGREETMRALTEVRAELKRVSQERDELRHKLRRVDSIQTETMALPDDDPGPSPSTANVPSLEDLMGALGKIEEPHAAVAGHLHQRVQGASDDSEEMISPLLVFPEQYAETADRTDEKGKGDAPIARILVLLDPERPIKYPLYKETITIGRADVADIQINNGFLSRLHARIVTTPEGVVVEDIESKNGIRVNSKVTERQTLRHGDIIDFGRLRFRFIDTASDDTD
jgi:hypothetical protein